jgi:hypothetical protein
MESAGARSGADQAVVENQKLRRFLLRAGLSGSDHVFLAGGEREGRGMGG